MAFNETEVQVTNTEQELETGNSFLDNLLSFVEESEEKELNIGNISEGFTIETMDQANYIVRKLKELREEEAEAIDAANASIKAHKEKVERWLQSVTNPLNSREDFYLNLLEVFAAEKLEGSSKKSIKLIEGTLQFRKQQDKYEYEDATLLTYVQENLEKYVKTNPYVDKTKLKKDGEVKKNQLYINGEPVKGIVITPRDDKFDVK